MPRIIGFFSDKQRANFEAARTAFQRGAALARTCGARLRTGATCTQLALDGERRCLRHCGPDAAKRHRARQLAGLETGSVTPEAWARAEQRRARNALIAGWKNDPRLPGWTIDLGADEGAFATSARAAGVDVDALYPALSDWLRWRWLRHQKDRPNDPAWQRVVQVDLPRQMAQADAAVQWQSLGGLDRRTKAAKAITAALRTRGHSAAMVLAARLTEGTGAGHVSPEQAAGCTSSPPLPDARPWTQQVAGTAWKRRLADRPQRQQASDEGRGRVPRALGRPKQIGRTADELAALASVLSSAGPAVRQMFVAIPRQEDQLRFLHDLAGFTRAPNDVRAREKWMVWAGAKAKFAPGRRSGFL